MKPFIEDLNKLASTGVTVVIRGSERTFKGTLLAFLADNLASNTIGGFKLSFSFAYRSCRTCLVPKSQLSSSFFSESFLPRTVDNYKAHCDLVEGPLGSHFSTTYGINHRSCLLDIKDFSMFGGGLPHDTMHDILEGVAPLEIKLLLLHLIGEKNITLDEYNQKLIHFSFGYSESDKPIPILSRVLHGDGSLRSTSSQILLLIRILPFIIGPKVPEDNDHWKCFLLLRKIIDIVLCPTTSKSLSASLAFLINEHHGLFFSLYGKCIPKMHFIVHYPKQMLALGPMIRTWTIRHEAKLNFFKQLTKLDNFKNICFSMANRHQRWACYELANGSILSKPIECGPGKGPSTLLNETNDIKEGLLQLMDISLQSTVFHPNWVRKDGILYKDDVFLITGSDGLDPLFVQLAELLVVGGDMVVFVVHPCITLYFDSHYHSYVVEVETRKVLTSDLADPNVLHGRKINGLTYVGLKYFFVS